MIEYLETMETAALMALRFILGGILGVLIAAVLFWPVVVLVLVAR